MISDEKRREVAKKMREYDVAEFKESAIVPFLECLGIGYVNWRGILDELADLIDRPTCRIGYVPCSADRSCSACGVTFSTGTYQGGDHEEHEFMFCPNCGAEVVSSDD